MRKLPKQYPYRAVRNAILRTLAVGGVIGVALVAPKVLKLLPSLDRAKTNRRRLYQSISQALERLEQSGTVLVSRHQGRPQITLTKRGEAEIDKLYAREYKIPEPAFWDGKWRILMFDIREKRRKARTKLRLFLEGAGFVRLQDSVWVYPYPCQEFVQLVRAHLASGTGEMLCFTAEALESDKALRAHFGLV